MNRPDAAAPKPVWRQWARTISIDVVPASAAVNTVLAEFLERGTTVLGFLPMPGEIDLRPLLAVGGRTWAVTRTPQTGPLTIHPADSPLEFHGYGFPQPVAGSEVVDPADVDVVLVPGLAFDTAGGRLGRGKGYYDELLARCRPDVTRVGVTVDALVVDAVPMEPHDLTMTHLVTESGLRVVG